MKGNYNGVTKINKFSKNKNPSGQKISTYGGRNDLIEADLYFQLRDENTELKKKLTELELKTKKMDVAIRKNKINPSEGINDFDLESLKIENENLKNKNYKMKQIIQGLQNELNSNNRRKTLLKSKGFLPSSYEKDDYIKTIQYLQGQLKVAHNERNNLLDELTTLKETKTSSTLASYSEDLRDKNSKLADLNNKYDKIVNSLETNSKILDLTKQGLQEYSDKYRLERNKNRELESIIERQQDDINQLNLLNDQIEEYKKKEALYEERIQDLCENPFIKNANERDKISVQLKETEMAFIEERRKLKNAESKIRELENMNKKLEEKNKIMNEKEISDDELKKKIILQEKNKQIKSMFGNNNEIPSDFQNQLDMLKYNNLEQLNNFDNKWQNMDFLEKMDEEQNDLEQLQKENKRLKIEKGILGVELEKTKNLLTLQQGINNDKIKVNELDKEKYKADIKYLKEEIEKLKELLEKARKSQIKKEEIISEKTSQKDKESDYNKDDLRISQRTLDSKITGFSIESEDYELNENAVDIYITTANYDENVLRNILNIELENLASFITVDFFLHQTETSNVTSGKKPNYNLQLTFRVIINDFFINFLKGEYIIVELYSTNNQNQKIIASGKIPLNQLIKAERNKKTRVIHGIIEMFLISNSSYKLCDIKYKMRMRKSILDILNWLEDKKELSNQLSPINLANNKIIESKLPKETSLNNLEYYDDNINNRVFAVRIMILKAENLSISFPSRKMSPYIYYKFYRKNEHFSKILSNPDDLFNDIAQFTCIYNHIFHDYILKDTLDIYIFDEEIPIEVDIGNDVRMVKYKENNDLIGICRINLKDLIFNGKIDDKFPIYNEDLNSIVGDLIVTISWEEINKFERQNNNINITIKKEGVDPLLIKLAAFLRDKGFFMETAFQLFDNNNQGNFSVDTFKNIILSIKFTNSNEDISRLIQIIFEQKPLVYRNDFYRVFNGLLPYENYNNSNSHFYENNIIEKDMEFSIDRKYDKRTGANESIYNEQSGNYNSGNMNMSGNNFNSGMNQNITNNENRNINEIMREVNNYVIGYGANAIDLYKMFDYDGNSLVGKKEMADGFGKLGILLNNDELEMIWKEIAGKEPHVQYFDFLQFKKFYNQHRYIPNKNRNSNIK